MKAIICLTLFLTACGQSQPPAPPQHVLYQVMDKSFVAGQHGSGVGMSMKGSLVFTSNSTRDAFKLLLRNPEDGAVFTEAVSIEVYSRVAVGDCLTYLKTSWSATFQSDAGPCPR